MVQSLDALVKQGEGDQDAVDLGNGIFMSKNIANSYLVTTSDGDLLINTGTDFEAEAIKGRFARVSNGPLRAAAVADELRARVSDRSLDQSSQDGRILDDVDLEGYGRFVHCSTSEQRVLQDRCRVPKVRPTEDFTYR